MDVVYLDTYKVELRESWVLSNSLCLFLIGRYVANSENMTTVSTVSTY